VFYGSDRGHALREGARTNPVVRARVSEGEGHAAFAGSLMREGQARSRALFFYRGCAA
jgi:hypothetical protein